VGELREKFGISRRTVLIAAAGAAPLLRLMTNEAEAGARVPQSLVHYRPSPKDGQDCDDCDHFVTPSRCELVDGNISRNGWCGLWVKKVG